MDGSGPFWLIFLWLAGSTPSAEVDSTFATYAECDRRARLFAEDRLQPADWQYRCVRHHDPVEGRP